MSTSQHVAYLKPRTLPRQTVRSARARDRAGAASRVAARRLLRQRRRPVRDSDAVRRDARGRPQRRRGDARAAVDRRSTPARHGKRSATSCSPPRRAVRGRREFSYPSPYIVAARSSPRSRASRSSRGRPLVAAAVDLMHRIHSEFTFDPGATTITTPVTRVLADRHGVCQDFAHLQIGCLRSLGLPARYVSGYLLTDPPPGQPRLVGADASHAWLSVCCPRAGLGRSRSHQRRAAHRSATSPIAWGRDYGDVSPLRGVVLGGRAAHAARRRQRDAGDGRRGDQFQLGIRNWELGIRKASVTTVLGIRGVRL